MIDVLIQAGHEGGKRNSGKGSTTSIGTKGEMERTPKVANKAAEVLKANGFTVHRENAFYDKVYDCKLAISIHFDGSSKPCASGASMGYPHPSAAPSNKVVADQWRKIYSEFWPYKWMPDNFTGGLRGYYGYAYTKTSVAELLLEMGELSCPTQKAWLDVRVDNGFLGELVAYFASVALGKPIAKPSEQPATPGDPTDPTYAHLPSWVSDDIWRRYLEDFWNTYSAELPVLPVEHHQLAHMLAKKKLI